jgi:hypothetical protein
MKERCGYPTHPFFALYGGRGIAVCERWKGAEGFTNFLADLGPRPVGMTLDRINVDGPYEPANCRWATPAQQRWNQRDMAAYGPNAQLPVVVDFYGETSADLPF